MAENKKQHYVPKMYLKRFLHGNNQFYLFNLNDMKEIGLVGYKDHCSADYFYGADKIWEKKLSNKEKKWDLAIDEIILNNFNNIDLLREFAAFQYARTYAYNEKLLQNTAKLYEEYLNIGLSGQNISCDESLIRNLALKKAEDITKPSGNLDLIEKIINEISDLSFVKIHYNTSKKLISSDNPVLLFNSYIPNNVGLGVIGLIIMFPINPENLLVFYDDKIYPKFAGKNVVEITNDYEVEKINSLIFANAREIIYSSCPFSNKIFCQKNLALKNDNLTRNYVDTLGPKDNKMIITRQPTIYHKMVFSFSKIDPLYYRINFDFRDPVMRKYDDAWKQKIFFRFQDSFIEIIHRVDLSLDIKRYKEGYKSFYYAMLKYWGVGD